MSDRRPILLTALLSVLVLSLVLAGPAAQAQSDSDKAEKSEKEPSKSDTSSSDKAAKSDEASAASPDKSAAQKKASDKSDVITNEDLERLFGASAAPPPPATAAEGDPKQSPPAGAQVSDPKAGAETPIQQLMDEQASRGEQQKLIAETEAKIAATEKKIKELERDQLAVKNPFFGARPKPSEEEQASWDASTTPERLAMIDKALDTARTELKDLQAELARMRSGR
jgi:hypothetical protein